MDTSALSDRLRAGTQRLQTAVGLLIVGTVSLVGPLLANASAILIAGGTAICALCLWQGNRSYREWVTTRQTELSPGQWMSQHLTWAAVGLMAIWIGALALRYASATDRRTAAVVGIGLVAGGLVPVTQVVRAKMLELTKSDGPAKVRGHELPPWLIWLLNGVLILAATVMPSVIVATNRRGMTIGLTLFLLWFISHSLSRGEWLPPRVSFWLGIGLLGLPLVGTVFLDRNRNLPPVVLYIALVVMLAGLVVLAARQRKAGSDRLQSVLGRVPLSFELSLLSLATLLTVGGIALFWAAVKGPGVPWAPVAIGILGLLLFGVSLVRTGEGFVLLSVVGLLMLWVINDHTDVPQSYATAPEGDQALVLAFGDSYMSGEGIGTFFDRTNTAGSRDYLRSGRNECRRSPMAYSPQLAERLAFSLTFDACSGAKAITDNLADDLDRVDLGSLTTEEFLVLAREAGEERANSVVGQLLRWQDQYDPEGNDGQPDLVLLSLGGNDLGFSQIGKACFLPGSCEAALVGRSELGLDAETVRVAVALEAIAESFPLAELAVVAYPQMFGDDDCGTQVPFDGSETRRLRMLVEELNLMVGRAIATVEGAIGEGRIVHLRETESAFVGARFCEREGPPSSGLVAPDAINSVNLEASAAVDLLLRAQPSSWIHNTFHPTGRGHQMVTDSLCSWFVESGYGRVTDEPCSDTIEPLLAQPETPESEVDVEETDLEAEAPAGTCGNLDSYVYCALVGTIQELVFPLVFLVAGGLLAALGWGHLRSNRSDAEGRRPGAPSDDQEFARTSTDN